MDAAGTQANVNEKDEKLQIKKEFDLYIIEKTNSYLPWISVICLVAETAFMFSDHYVRHDPHRIYARVLPVVLSVVIFLMWLSKVNPLKLWHVRRLWDISLFITTYWLCLLSVGTPAHGSAVSSISDVVFGITFLSCYTTVYLAVLFGSFFSLYVFIIVAVHGFSPFTQKELFELNGPILLMSFCLALNKWRNNLYFSEFSLKRKLETTIDQLAETQERLIYTEKMAAVGELTSGIAHEIQNPLNFVINFSDMSATVLDELEEEVKRPVRDLEYEGVLYADLKANLSKIASHGKRISSIVKGMLEHSRINANQHVAVPTNLNALVNEYLLLAYHNAKIKYATLEADLITTYDDQLAPVDLIPQEMSRVLLNLFDNAFYAVRQQRLQQVTGYAPAINVSTGINNGQVTIRVADNGTGIPDAIRKKVFQPFFTSKPTGEGTGLGLSISYEIVTKGHSGTLDLVSREGLGTEFIITLPLKRSHKMQALQVS